MILLLCLFNNSAQELVKNTAILLQCSMDFLNQFLQFLKDFFDSIFASSSPEYQKKQKLKAIHNSLRTIDPPIYGAEGVLLPAFPTGLHQIHSFLMPVRKVLEQTIASPDRRQAERFKEGFLEALMSAEQRENRKKLTYASRSAELVTAKCTPERLVEDQAKILSQFIKSLEAPHIRQAITALERLEALSDLCFFDFNDFFSYFDPAFKTHAGQETTVESPSFKSVEIAEVIPPLLDMHYLFSRVSFQPNYASAVTLLEALLLKEEATEENKTRLERTFEALSYLCSKKISAESILSVLRITHGDPLFVPEQPQNKTDYLQLYKTHVTEIFDSDSRKLIADKQNSEIKNLLSSLFGDRPIETLEGYSQNTLAMLQEFTVFTLEWIEPLQIIKTFAKHYFEALFAPVLRSVIVEGYFTNRGTQSNLSTAFFYCESVTKKIEEFENLFEEGQSFSIKILTGYITALETGMDFEKPLQKLVENMNNHAKALVQQAVTQYADIFNFSTMIIQDAKQSVPELITNIRAIIQSTKNSTSFQYLEKDIGIFRSFLEIMKRYAIVGTLSVPASQAEHTGK